MAERQIRHRKSCLVLSARFPVVNWRSRPVAKSAYCVIFIGYNLESRASQVGLHKQNQDTASAKKGKVSLLVSWFTVKKLECLEFITYEVARSVASRPRKNAPLAKKLLRSTCIRVGICSMSIKKLYCAFHKHTNSKVQKPPSRLRFWLPSIIITITSNKPWNTETHKTDRNPPITNQKPWPFEPVKVKFCSLRGPLRWLGAAKNAIVSWVLNFRIRMCVKSAVRRAAGTSWRSKVVSRESTCNIILDY